MTAVSVVRRRSSNTRPTSRDADGAIDRDRASNLTAPSLEREVLDSIDQFALQRGLSYENELVNDLPDTDARPPRKHDAMKFAPVVLPHMRFAEHVGVLREEDATQLYGTVKITLSSIESCLSS